MNDAHADSSESGLVGLKPQTERRDAGWPAAPKPPGKGRSRQQWVTFVALVFAAQVAVIVALGEKKFPPPRAVKNVPQLTLADNSSEWIALDDPTLFALPHPGDFMAAMWSRSPVTNQPPFRLTEAPRWLPLSTNELMTVFNRFMQTNRAADFALQLKPPARLSTPAQSIEPAFAQLSTMRVEGDLAQRRLLTPMPLTPWPYADVIAPSKVQLLVNEAGDVVSAILLPSDNSLEALSHYEAADQRALELARAAHFAPAPRLTIGRMIFTWLTIPPPATNSPAASP